MRPFFPLGSTPNQQHNAGVPQGSMPPFPLNQSTPQFQNPQANFSNPNNLAMAMSLLNQNPQLGLGFNQAFQNFNALAAVQFIAQLQQQQQQQGQMQNRNFLGARPLFGGNFAQGFNQMVNNNSNLMSNNNIGQNPILAAFANNMVQMNQANTSNVGQNSNNNNNNQNNISQARFQNNQFSPSHNQNKFSGARGRGRGRGMQFGRTGARGQGNWREGKMDLTTSDTSPIFPEKRKKRLPLIIYDPKEIKDWREARKRNFPTTSNIEKKIAKSENDEAELRRQQMKEILAKQEELGFEAAEVPTHYLTGSENNTRYNNSNKNTQNSNRFNNKRGRFGGRGRNNNHNNNNNYRNAPRNNHNYNKRREFDSKITEPSLLKKLLSAEIKADKRRILHALKFMVLNEFFEDLGENRELKFPEIRINGEEKIEEILEDLEGNELSDERESESEDEREVCEKPEEGEITD